MAHSNQHTDIEITHSSMDHEFRTDTVKSTLNLGIESTDKTDNIVTI